MNLHEVYECSQIALVGIAVVAAFVGFLQVATFKRFEMLKYIESSDIRRSRRTVYQEIKPKPKTEEWWNDPCLERAASDVCASYDILGLMIERNRVLGIPLGGYGMFERYWAQSIVDNHNALDSYLDYRQRPNPKAYSAFDRLAARSARRLRKDKTETKLLAERNDR